MSINLWYELPVFNTHEDLSIVSDSADTCESGSVGFTSRLMLCLNFSFQQFLSILSTLILQHTYVCRSCTTLIADPNLTSNSTPAPFSHVSYHLLTPNHPCNPMLIAHNISWQHFQILFTCNYSHTPLPYFNHYYPLTTPLRCTLLMWSQNNCWRLRRMCRRTRMYVLYFAVGDIAWVR